MKKKTLENIRQGNSDELLNQAITELEIRDSVLPYTHIKALGQMVYAQNFLNSQIIIHVFSYVAYLMKY